MLYLIKIGEGHKAAKNHKDYYLFETNTDSLLHGDTKFVIELVEKYKLKPKNFILKNNQVEPSSWPHAIRSTSEQCGDFRATYILLSRENEQRFKTVNSDGDVFYTNENELKTLIQRSVMANCSLEKGIYKSIDTYSISNSVNFEKQIASKYEAFRSKALLTGIDISFKYKIEENRVNLLDYTGTSKKVIIPSFITIINKQAFKEKEITELSLNSGLRYIGNEAFRESRIYHVDVPNTVRFIGKLAFHSNNRSVQNRYIYNKDEINVLNSNALIIDMLN